MTQQQYAQMILEGGRFTGRQSAVWAKSGKASPVASISASVYTSHIPRSARRSTWERRPSRTGSPCSAAISARRVDAKHVPDAIVLVYNDHATAFSLDLVRRSRSGPGSRFMPADEGWVRGRSRRCLATLSSPRILPTR